MIRNHREQRKQKLLQSIFPQKGSQNVNIGKHFTWRWERKFSLSTRLHVQISYALSLLCCPFFVPTIAPVSYRNFYLTMRKGSATVALHKNAPFQLSTQGLGDPWQMPNSAYHLMPALQKTLHSSTIDFYENVIF